MMTNIETVVTVKQWIYVDAQSKAGKYNFTLVWSHEHDAGKDYWTSDDTFNLYGTITRETEKAVLMECDYWNLNKAGRYITDAPRCKGFKVWIPKSAILCQI